MKFLLDENVGKKVAEFLQQLGYSTIRIKDINPGVKDYQVLELAMTHNAVLITSDTDFGELIFKEKQPHCGVILLRLQDESSDNKILALKKTLQDKISENSFIVITETARKFKIRVAKVN